MTVHGDGSAARDWLFVEDHCDALDRLVHVDINSIRGEVINLGTEQHRSVLEIAQAVQSIVESDSMCLSNVGTGRRRTDVISSNNHAATSQIQFVGDRPGQVFRHTSNASKAKKILGWEPKTDFEEGLRRTIRWYKENQSWWQPQLWMRHIPIVTAAGKKEMH